MIPCPSTVSGFKKMKDITANEGENIIIKFVKTSLKEKNLFSIIKITAKKGAKRITSSQIKHKIGKVNPTNKLINLVLIFFSQKIKMVTKQRKINISFRPKDSISAIGYKRKIGEKKANICKIFNLKFFK